MSHNQAHSSTFRTSTRLATRTHCPAWQQLDSYEQPMERFCFWLTQNVLLKKFPVQYSWKDTQRLTSRKKKSNGTLCASATRTPLLNRSAHSLRVHTRQEAHIWPSIKSLFIKPQARSTIREFITYSLRYLSRNVHIRLFIKSLFTNPHVRSTIRELNSSWYMAKRRSTIWLKASVLSASCCCTYSYTFLVVQVNVIEITFFSELAHTKPETFVATVTLTGLESTCHHLTYKHCTSPVTILPGTVLLKCFPIQLL
jgi:hypothetical protein